MKKSVSFFILLITLVVSWCTNSSSLTTNSSTGMNTNRPTPPIGGRPRDQGIGGYTLTEEQKNTCGISVQTTEGPYYVQNTPQLADNMNLNYDSLPGKSLIITGKVYGWLDNTITLSGAKIEIRQADDGGKYYPQANGDFWSYWINGIKLRGYILTDIQGNYTIKTIYPWLYEWRARHIHLRVSAEEYNPVITQLILPFPWDTPTPEDDNVAQWLPNCQIISGDQQATTYERNFDFRLKAE